MEDHILGVGKTHDAAKNRFILDLDRTKSDLQVLPSSIASLLSILPRSPLLRAATRLILLEPFRSKRKGSDQGDESVDTFLKRRFGSEIAKLATAGMHGIYAASTSDLSAQAILGSVWELERDHGSVLWGLIRRDRAKAKVERERKRAELLSLGKLGKDAESWSMYGLKGGVGSLLNKMGDLTRENGVDLRLGEGITGLKPLENGVEVCELISVEQRQTAHHDQ
jgi:oxygen-dependent protoporphyrinogen oxidase